VLEADPASGVWEVGLVKHACAGITRDSWRRQQREGSGLTVSTRRWPSLRPIEGEGRRQGAHSIYCKVTNRETDVLRMIYSKNRFTLLEDVFKAILKIRWAERVAAVEYFLYLVHSEAK
jgi:hypothetical protein